MWMVIARALVTGLLVAGSAALPWSLLAAGNMKETPAVPWAPVVMAIYLLFWWRFLRRWPQFRVHPLAPGVWRWSLLGGGLAILSAVALLLAVLHLTGVPPIQLPDTSKFSPITIVAFAVMSAVVAGVGEEAGFRGFMQVPLERAYGPAVAIAFTSVVFGLAHLTHGASIVRIAAATLYGAIYGLLAWAAGSILPGILLHSAFDAFEFVFARSLRQLPPGNQWLWIHLGEAVVLGIAAWFAFRRLLRQKRLN